MQKKILRGAKQTLDKFNKELDSSSQAVALKQTNFQVAPLIAQPKPVKVQIEELSGKAKDYHTPEYGVLMGKLLPLRREFPKTKEVAAR